MNEHFEPKRQRPCWACPNHHCQVMTITAGPYKVMVVEGPEYEQMSAPVGGHIRRHWVEF